VADLQRLLRDLDDARAAFVDALEDVDAELVTVPGVVGVWSVRDLVVHVAAWAEHGAGALDLATAGRGAEFAYNRSQTDAMNDDVQAQAGSTSPADALVREESAFGAFRDRAATLDPAMLSAELGNGDTVEAVIRYDGIDHYAEHTAHLRAWFDGNSEADEEDDVLGPV